MSHLYQPVMLRRLLVNRGTATRREIAQDILDRDPTQLEYYEKIVLDMVGRVLTAKQNLVSKAGDTYELCGFDALSADEAGDLVAICDEQIAAYQARRGSAMWEHRRRSSRALSGTVRYEVRETTSRLTRLEGAECFVRPFSLGCFPCYSAFDSLNARYGNSVSVPRKSAARSTSKPDTSSSGSIFPCKFP